MQGGWGMVLRFPEPGEHLIAASTMRFPIDIAMAGVDGAVHTVHRDVAPGSKALLGGLNPTLEVLEVSAGSTPITVGALLVVDD